MGRTASGVRVPSSTAATPMRPGLRLGSAEPTASVGLDTPGTVSHTLAADLTAVREARTVVQQVLGTWRAEEIYDDVALVASELVANAVRHGMKAELVRIAARSLPERSLIEPEGVRISLVSTGRHVICSVTDPSARPPVRRLADPLEGSGRGLQLVESLSLCWGWTVLDGEATASSGGAVQGKSVWAIFPLARTNRSDRRASQSQVVGAA